MPWIGIVPVLFGLAFAADESRNDVVGSDMEKLQGSWAVALFFVNGEEIPANQVKPGELLVDDNEYRPKLGADVERMTFQIKPARSLKEIDFTYPSGFQKGKTSKGIYKLDGDTLTICRAQGPGKARPTEFSAPSDSGLMLIVWKRTKTAAGERVKAVQAELKRFEATWEFVGIEISGRQVPPEAFKGDTLVLKGRQFSQTVQGRTTNGTFKIDPTVTPKTIDIIPASGPRQDSSLKGIYELDGDTQKICMSAPGKPRPTEFITKPDVEQIIQVLQRVKR